MTGRRERRRGGEGRTKAKLRRLLIKEAVPLLFDSINGRFSLGLRREFACMNETLPGIVSSVNTDTYRDCVYTHTYTYTARLKYDTRNHLPHHASVIIPIFNACTILFDDSLLQCNNQITFYPPFFLRRRNTLEKERKKEKEKTLTLTVLTGVESFAGHLEQRVQRAPLSRGPLPVMPALGPVLLRRFPLELLLLLLLLLLQHRVMQARMHTVMHAVMMMAQRIRASGIGHGTPPGRGRAAEGWLADRAGRHRRQGHAHQGQIPGRRGMIGMMVVMVEVMVMVVLLLLLLLLLLVQVVAVVEMVVVEMVVIRLDRVPRAHDLRLRSVRQDVQYAERLDPALVRVPIPLVLLVRVLHLHHLQTFQRLEVIVRGTTVTASPTVHFLLVLLLVLLLLFVPQRGHGVAAAAPLVTYPP